MTRFQKIVIALLALLVTTVIVVGIVIAQGQAAEVHQAEYLRCLAAHGYTPEDMPETDAGLRKMLAETEACVK